MPNITLGSGNQTYVFERGVVSGDTITDFASQYYDGAMDGAQAGTPTTATATASLALSLGQDRLSMDMEFFGILTSSFTAFHIHQGLAGQNGGVVFGFIGPNNDTDGDLVIGNDTIVSIWDGSEGNGTTLGAQLANLNASGLYFNVHTAAYGSGEIRGQIIPDSTNADLIDLTAYNVGSFTELQTLLFNTSTYTEITAIYGGVQNTLRLNNIDPDDLNASHFIFAGAVDETITGTSSHDNLFGAGGVDTINGENGNDRLHGGEGDDTLNGGAGNDRLTGGIGADILDGGAGEFDTARYDFSSAAVTIYLNSFADGGDATGDTLTNFYGVYGSAFDDTLVGDAEDNELQGLAGRDTLYGLGGDDFIIGGSEFGAGDFIAGGAGNDLINAGGGDDVIYGESGADSLIGGSGNDVLYVDGADTSVSGGTDEDYLIVADAGGGSWSASDIENWIGASGADIFDASADTDLVYMQGGGGNDTLNGGSAGDFLFGDGDNDTINGGGGNDYIVGGLGADALSGGEGTDVLYFDAADTAVNGGAGFDYAIAQDNSGVALGMTGQLIEYAVGGSGNDILSADLANWFVEIYGNAGNDTLYAGTAGSIMIAGDGIDHMHGGLGTDHYVGGAGADVFHTHENNGVDYVYDFEDGIDIVEIENVAGVSSFADLLIDTTYQADGWFGVDYGTGTIWLQAGAGATIDAADFQFHMHGG